MMEALKTVIKNTEVEKYLSGEYPTGTRTLNNQIIFKFTNGYGASVIRGMFTYGLFELAVLGKDGHLTYDTPITDDVLGSLTPEDVKKHLEDIMALI